MEVDRPLIVGPEKIEWHPVEIPDQVEPGNVRVRSLVSLISPGTELRLYRGEPMVEELWDTFADIDVATTSGMGMLPEFKVTRRNEPGEASYPVAVGYNMVGEVTDVGEGVTLLAPGDRVLALARHQPVFDLLDWQAVRVPDGVPTDVAPFAYLPTLGLHALRRAGFTPGHNVAVIGLGLVGLGAALVADAVGAKLACFEVNNERRARASAALPRVLMVDPSVEGFEESLMTAFSPFGFDIVIEAAVGAAPLDLGMRILDQGGLLVAIALHPEDVGSLLAADFYNKQSGILGTSNAPYEDPALRRTRFTSASNVAYLYDLYERGRLGLERLHTGTYPAAEVGVAYADLAAGERDMIGVLLDWR